MRLITGQDEIIAKFVSEGIKRTIYPPYVAIGWVAIDKTGNWKLVSGAVFNDYTGASVEITIYGRMTRQTIRESMAYVFVQLKCLRMTARTRRGNARMRRILPRMGFVLEGVLKHFYGPSKQENALIFRLDAEQAQRWLNGQHAVASDPS